MNKAKTYLETKGGPLTEDDFVGEYAPGDSEKSHSPQHRAEWDKMIEELKRRYEKGDAK